MTFLESAEPHVTKREAGKLRRECSIYENLSAPQEKAACIKRLMDILEGSCDSATCHEIMQASGRRCICKSVIVKAVRLKKQSASLDELLAKLNANHIGGGHLERKGKVIHAKYDRCYCGSVSNTSERFSATYCECSCGWYRELFETLLERPVTVELLGSIIQGDKECRFRIRI